MSPTMVIVFLLWGQSLSVTGQGDVGLVRLRGSVREGRGVRFERPC